MWPFSNSKTTTSESQPDIISTLDPSLQTFYKQAEPVKPISLAPAELKQQIAQDQTARKNGFSNSHTAFDDTELNSANLKYTDSSGDRIQTLWDATNENCALLNAKYADCQRHGPIWSIMMSCYKESEAHRKCLNIQKRALTKAGYTQALTTPQRNYIKYSVDDLYTKHFPDGAVVESAQQEFFNDVDELQKKIKENMYRVD